MVVEGGAGPRVAQSSAFGAVPPPGGCVPGGGGARARPRRRTGKEAGPRRRAPPERAQRRRRGSRGAGSWPERGFGCTCGIGLGGHGHDEHGVVAGELAVRLLVERDGGAHLRLLHHYCLQRQERPGAAACLADHAKKCRRLHWT